MLKSYELDELYKKTLLLPGVTDPTVHEAYANRVLRRVCVSNSQEEFGASSGVLRQACLELLEKHPDSARGVQM